jgi:hypothetical protein
MVAISPTWAESMVARLRRSIQLTGRWKRRSRIGLAADQARENRAHFRADAGKAREVGIEGIEDRIAHCAAMLAGLGRACSRVLAVAARWGEVGL